MGVYSVVSAAWSACAVGTCQIDWEDKKSNETDLEVGLGRLEEELGLLEVDFD